jgi:hypothetical protein
VPERLVLVQRLTDAEQVPVEVAVGVTDEVRVAVAVVLAAAVSDVFAAAVADVLAAAVSDVFAAAVADVLAAAVSDVLAAADDVAVTDALAERLADDLRAGGTGQLPGAELQQLPAALGVAVVPAHLPLADAEADLHPQAPASRVRLGQVLEDVLEVVARPPQAPPPGRRLVIAG